MSKNVLLPPIFSNKTGKNKDTKKQEIHTKTIDIDMALPRTLFGKSSEISTHATGPHELANAAIYINIEISLMVLFNS